MPTVDIKTVDLVDFHSHILPGVDHGSTSLETSLKQVEHARANGVSRIIATPHFYPHRHLVDDFLQKRENGYKELISAIDTSKTDIRLGAELLVCENIYRMPGIEKLCVSGTSTLLLEFPLTRLDERHYKMVYDIVNKGFDVVIAHVDRYNADFIDSLYDLGVKYQLNASAMCQFLKPRKLKPWLKEGRIVALGSDVHGDLPTPYNNFSIAKHKLSDYLPKIKEASDSIWNPSSNFIN